MRGVYTIDAKITSLSTSKSLVLLTAPATACLEILSASVGNAGTNVTNQQLEVEFARVTTLGSPVGTAQTPSPEENGDQAAAATATVNLTTEPTTVSTTKVFDHQGFASLAGYQHVPVPEERINVPPSGSIVLKMMTAPTAFDCVVSVRYREIG
jgi:hypothetical protein